ncbi:REX4 [Porites harrisoni]
MADESKRNGPKLKRRCSEERDKKKDHKRIHPNKSKKKEKNNKIIQPRIPKTATDISSNWKLLQVMLKEERNVRKEKSDGKSRSRAKQTFKKKIKLNHPEASEKTRSSEVWFDDVDPEDLEQVTGKRMRLTSEDVDSTCNETLVTGNFEGITKKIALDCEMVGVGFDGKQHMLARVSIVNSHGHVVYDSFVAPQEKVMDYRTPISGVKPTDLKNAPDFKTVQLEVSKLLRGRILVGHALKNDLAVLFLDHPRKNIRDTAKYKPFQERVKSKKPALRTLSKQLLNITIQEGEHSSVQDAQVAMKLYTLHRNQWERQLKELKFKHLKNDKSQKKLASRQIR